MLHTEGSEAWEKGAACALPGRFGRRPHHPQLADIDLLHCCPIVANLRQLRRLIE